MAKVSIHLFGPPQFFLDETPLKVERRKTLALLSYLGCALGEGRSRETLSALLWPDASQEQAAAYLRQALWDFSKVAGEGWVERDGPVIRLLAEKNVQVDVLDFRERVDRWKRGDQERLDGRDNPEFIPLLEEAARLYTADFLAGFSLRDCPDFDEWQTLQAEGLRLQLGEALEALARLYQAQGAYEQSIASARRWLALDALNENAHRALMRLYDATGQRSAALRQYETCQRRLQEELGVAPEPATIQLFQQISARRAAPAGAAGRASAPLDAAGDRERKVPPARPALRPPVPVFLPTQTTPFLGREAELARIRVLLASPECRMVSLVGPGGSGKTRLAIQAAGQSIGYPHQLSFPHGIYFTGLASAAIPADAIQGIARALKLEFRSEARQGISPEAAREQLLRFLAEKKILLVLDNLEQLDSYTFLSDLLAEAQGLKLIVTSRVRLNLPEEWVLEVGGLPFPAQDGLPQEIDLENLQRYAAVQLFVKCAGRTGSFTPSKDDWPAIARICQMVDGLPLGVELAAAWVKMLSCPEIAEEITRSLDFLESTHPGVPERQRSLRGVFEHSWRLLSENERAVFRRLAIFRGGFTREAAFQVAGASLGLLGAFVDKSMLRRVSSGRFDLHELVKQFAAEKLATDPAAQSETEARHAQYYADWLRQKSEPLRGRDQLAALAALRGDMHNLRAAWCWLAEHRLYEQIEPIVSNVILFHEMQGEHDAGVELMQILAGAIRKDGDASPPRSAESKDGLPSPSYSPLVGGLLGLALAATRHFHRASVSIEQNRRLQEESMALAEALPPTHPRAFILILNSTGPGIFSADQAIAMCREGAEIFQATGDLWGSGLAHLVMADSMMFTKGDAAQARATYAAGMTFFDRMGNDWGRALCFFGLAAIAWGDGRLDEAAHLIEQSVHIYEQMGNAGRLLDARGFAGKLAAQRGQRELARQYFAANLAYLTEVGERQQSAYYAQQIAELEKINGTWMNADERG